MFTGLTTYKTTTCFNIIRINMRQKSQKYHVFLKSLAALYVKSHALKYNFFNESGTQS